MYFDYESYMAYCFVAPMMGVLFFSFLLVGGIIGFINVCLKKKLVRKDIEFLCIGVTMLVLLLCIDGGVLLHGGIHLWCEKQSDAVEMQGEISDIRGLGLSSFPRVDCNYEYGEFRGYEFSIDDVRCTAVVKGSLEVGDYVTVKYLPKSGYILYIAETEEESADIE